MACMHIFKGMFNDEVVVKYDSLSFFVSKDHVSGTAGNEGRVRVRAFPKEQKWFAVLPTDDQAIISVSRSDLRKPA